MLMCYAGGSLDTKLSRVKFTELVPYCTTIVNSDQFNTANLDSSISKKYFILINEDQVNVT